MQIQDKKGYNVHRVYSRFAQLLQVDLPNPKHLLDKELYKLHTHNKDLHQQQILQLRPSPYLVAVDTHSLNHRPNYHWKLNKINEY